MGDTERPRYTDFRGLSVRGITALQCIYSKIPILRPLFGLPKSGLISEVVLISNTISYRKYHLGVAKTGLNSEVV